MWSGAQAPVPGGVCKDKDWLEMSDLRGAICSILVGFGKPASQDALATYVTALSGCDKRDIGLALRRACRCKWCPTPGELFSMVEECRAARERPLEDCADTAPSIPERDAALNRARVRELISVVAGKSRVD